jgi:hypothetical protein
MIPTADDCVLNYWGDSGCSAPLRTELAWPEIHLGEPIAGATGVTSWPAHATSTDANAVAGMAPMVVHFGEGFLRFEPTAESR